MKPLVIKDFNVNSFYISSPLKSSMGETVGHLIGIINENKLNKLLNDELNLESRSTISASTYIIVDDKSNSILESVSLKQQKMNYLLSSNFHGICYKDILC